MGFRFPPHSAYAKDIDLYTFLPSVLDSRRGVCLGVSILYLCLAQRLDLNLEIITPPGHIFVRWRNGNETINIERTARGIQLPDEEYLGIDTRALEQRNIKETIGMAHVNQASIFWSRQEYDQVKASYEKALPYLPNYKLLTLLMGYVDVILGDKEQGEYRLKEVVDYIAEEAVSKETIPEDYFSGNVSPEGIKAVFLRVDETRESLLKKKKDLEVVLATYPKFREGLFSLAGTWLQLHRTQEALECLERYHKIDPSNASVEYYLAAIYAERRDYNNAWVHLHIAENLVAARQHRPQSLDELRQELAKLSPE
jgi:tetratricopeptide (TPR) repeat protein